jgi:hypothetical protein
MNRVDSQNSTLASITDGYGIKYYRFPGFFPLLSAVDYDIFEIFSMLHAELEPKDCHDFNFLVMRMTNLWILGLK